MSVFFRAEQRALSWDSFFRGTGTSDGVTFASRQDLALTVIPVYAAVSLIADQFAVLPLSCYIGTKDSTTRIDTPGFLLNPDPRITVLDWRYQAAVSLKLRGNAYGLVTGSGVTPSGIVWLHPDWVSVDETTALSPRYFLFGKEQTLWQHGGRLIHIREFVQPGSVLGLSPIAQFRATYETASAATGYGRDWFKNSAIPSGILRNEKGTLKPGQSAEAKALFMDSTRGREPVVLDSNWTWQQISIAPEEAQFLQTIKATATQIAAIFRVSPEDIGGEAGNSRTYSNREMDQEVLNVRTLLPLTTRIEMSLDVLLPAEQFVKHDMDVLNRPTLIDRSRANTEQLKNGTLTLAEARIRENRRPLTPAEIAEWQDWFSTMRSESESTSNATSTSTSIVPK